MQGIGMVLVWCGFLLVIGLIAGLATTNVMARSSGTGASIEAGLHLVVRLGAVAGSVCLIASLSAVWIRGTGPDGNPLDLSGWSGLDPLTLVGLVIGALTGALSGIRGGPKGRRSVLLIVTGCIDALLVGGNLLIQSAHPSGSRVAVGFWIGLVASVVVILSGVLSLRLSSEPS